MPPKRKLPAAEIADGEILWYINDCFQEVVRLEMMWVPLAMVASIETVVDKLGKQYGNGRLTAFQKVVVLMFQVCQLNNKKLAGAVGVE